MTDTPITPTAQIAGATPPTQDLQIDLEELTPKTETQPATGNLQPETDLDLDLNLPEATKNDDRLQQEDKKNQETPTEKTEVQDTPDTEELIKEETPVQQPSTTIEEIPVTPKSETTESVIQPKTLQEDMHIIDQLAASASSGGLAPEANITTKPITETQEPKTFDLDAMLGTTVQTTTPAPITTKTSPDRGRNEEGVVSQTPTPQQEPMTAPAFTIPTTETIIPAAAIIQTTTPTTPLMHKKNMGVKVLLFSVLFVALGFTSYFILQTMYPVEFAQMFNRENTETMHASEEILPEITTGSEEEIATGTLPEIMTGSEENTSEEMNFGELNELTEPQPQEATDVSRLTDYINQGNEFVEIGKANNDTTVIKYAMYITKKATDFLTKIANGEEINNLSGYFAQFDKYLVQLETLVNSVETSSPAPETTNETTETMTSDTIPTTETNPLSAE